MPDISELGRLVKAKYPGAYDHVPDDELGMRVRQKYPGAYQEYVPAQKPAPQTPAPPDSGGLLRTIAEPFRRIGEAVIGSVDPATGRATTAIGEMFWPLVDERARSARARAPWEAPPIVDVGALRLQDLLPDSWKAPRGAVAGTQDVATSLTTPLNALLLAGTGGVLNLFRTPAARSAAQRLMSAGFSGDMLHTALQHSPDFAAQVEAGDTEGAARTLTNIAGSGAFAALAARHALAPEPLRLPAADRPAEPTPRQAREIARRERMVGEQKAAEARRANPQAWTEQPAPERENREQRRASVEPPRTDTVDNPDLSAGAMQEPRVLVDPRLREIAAELGLGEWERLSEADRAVVRRMRDEGWTAAPERSSPGDQPRPAPDAQLPAEPPTEQASRPAPARMEPRIPATPPIYGRETEVLVPGERKKYRAVYALREADDVQASHNATTFERNPKYEYVNDRNYTEPQNAERIVKQVAEFDPDYLVNDNPTAENGPPIIDVRGNVLGGNSRTMTLERVEQSRPEAAAAYRQRIIEQAKKFGIPPELAQRMKRPRLVREIAEEIPNPQAAITDFNKVGTAELRLAERAIADSRRVTPETLERITRRIEEQGPEGTLAQALEGDARDIIERLVQDGVLTTQEKPRLLTGDGRLTQEGKQRVTRLLTGRLFEDARQFDEAAPELKAKLERIVAPLARVEGREGWDITEATREAIKLLEEARRRDQSIDDLVAQRGLFGDTQFSEQAVSIARKLQEKPTAVAKAFRQYAAEAEMGAHGQGLLGMEPPTPAESFREAFREYGEFGPIYREFHHDNQRAVEHLKRTRNGEAIGALHDREIGDIDLPWGWSDADAPSLGKRGGAGLAHIIYDHPDLPNIEYRLQDILDAVSSRKQQGDRKVLQGSKGKVIVALTWMGKKSKRWVITAYEPPAGEKILGALSPNGGETTPSPTGGPTISVSQGPAERKPTISALDRIESEAKARIAQRWKDAGTTLSAGPGLAAEQLADYAIVGAAKIAKGAIKFGQWSAEMIAEFGEEIRPYLGKIWMQARRLAQEQAGEGGAAGKPAATATATPPVERPVTSPSYERTKPKVLEHVSEPVRQMMERRLADYEARNPERRTIGFDDIVEEARALDPQIVASLDVQKLRAGDTLRPEVRLAARETLLQIEKEIAAKDEALRQDPAPDVKARLLEQREALDRDARRLIDVLIPTRSQDGRNLAYHRIMAEGSFDATYWLARARRAMALPDGAELPPDVQAAIREATRKGQAAEDAAIDRVVRQRAAREAAAEAGVEPEAPAAPRRRRDRRTVDEQGRPLPTMEERLAHAKQLELERIRRQMSGEQPERRPSKWELTPEERRMVDADPEVRAARIELARRLAELEKTGWLDAVIAFRRAGLLTGPRTHLRNLGGNLAFQVLEDVSKVPGAVVDSILSVFSKRRAVLPPNFREIAAAGYQAATRGIVEARQILREGATKDQLAQLDLVKEINTGNKPFDTAVNMVFRIMSAEDRIFKVYAFERSLREQMKLAGVSEPTDAMRVKAWEDAAYATFNNANPAAEAWSAMKARLRTSGAAGQAIATGMDLAVPYARTPSNIVARVIDYTPPGAAVRAGHAVYRAMVEKGWTPDTQRAFSMAIGRGMTGAALLYLGYWLAKQKLMTGVRDEARGDRDVAEAAGMMDASIRVGDTWHRVDAISPVGNLLVLGATLEQQEVKKGAAAAMAMAAGKTVMEQPMLRGTKDVVEAVGSPGRRADRVAGSMAGSFVPTIVSDVASLADAYRRDTRGDTTVDALTHGVMARTPGLRNQLPPRLDLFGKPLEQRPVSVILPTIGSPAKDAQDPVLRELVQSGAEISKRPKRQEETDTQYQRRLESEGKMIRSRLEWLFRTNRYQEASPEERKELIKEQVSRARAEHTRQERKGLR